MAFTVTRDDGQIKDAEFETYARLLRQQGTDLGKLPRVPEPGTGRRWLYVWESKEKAQAFADELNKLTRSKAWVVVDVVAPPSEGPLGPIVVQVGRRATGLVFSLHPLSRGLIKSAYPDARPSVATVSVAYETLNDFQMTQGSFDDLSRDVLPTLTDLSGEQLTAVGYAFIEDDTNKTLVFVPPADIESAKKS